MLTVVFEVDAPELPQGVKERIGMMLEQFGGRVRCVSVTHKGSKQITMDAWKKERN